jgi:hypothetical protein
MPSKYSPGLSPEKNYRIQIEEDEDRNIIAARVLSLKNYFTWKLEKWRNYDVEYICLEWF